MTTTAADKILRNPKVLDVDVALEALKKGSRNAVVVPGPAETRITLGDILRKAYDSENVPDGEFENNRRIARALEIALDDYATAQTISSQFSTKNRAAQSMQAIRLNLTMLGHGGGNTLNTIQEKIDRSMAEAIEAIGGGMDSGVPGHFPA